MIKHIQFLLLIALLANGFKIHGQSSPPEDEVKVLQDLTIEAKKNLLVMLRTGQEVLSETSHTPGSPDQARILREGTPVYSSRYDTTSLVEYLDRDETYAVIERQPGYLHIQLENDKDGWIRSDQAFVTGKQTINPTLATLSNAAAAKIEVTHRLYFTLEVLERKFKKVYNSIDAPTAEINSIHKEFYRHLSNARNYYQTHFANLSIQAAALATTTNRFSGTFSLATGSSTFHDDYSETLSEEFKGSLTDIVLKGLYRLDPNNYVDFNIDTRSELIETPFKSNNYQLGFRRNVQNTHFSVGAGLNQYQDKYRGINSYDRLQVNTRLQHAMNEKNVVSLQYQFTRNNYDSESSADYSRHHLSAGTESRTKKNNLFLLQFRGNLSTSDRQNLNFIHLLPSITIRKIKPNSSTDYAFSYESFAYEELYLQNSVRGTFGISYRNRKALGKALHNEFLLSYITYQENQNIDHVKMSIRTSNQNFINGNRFSTFGLTAKYFHYNEAGSYLDIRYDAGSSSKLFSQLSLFNRLYYPVETVVILPEANLKLGVQIEGFKLGPVLSVRGTINSEDINFEADGNYFRIGAFLEGSRTFKNGLHIALNGAYDYGNVYSEDITIDPITGLINAGEVMARNPVTIRFSFQAGYTVMKLFDLFANFDFYKIDRDYFAVAGLNPILSSDRLSFKLGFVYRYN